MRTLYTSIPALLNDVSNDDTTAEDLKDAFFFFIGKREHLMDPSNADQTNEVHAFFRSNPPRGEAVRKMLADAVRIAENEGRVAYHEAVYPDRGAIHNGLSIERSWEKLDEFLADNGCETIDTHCGVDFDCFDAIRIETAVRLSVIGLEAVS